MLKLIVNEKKQKEKKDSFYAKRYEALEEKAMDELLNLEEGVSESKIDALICKMYLARLRKCYYKYAVLKKNNKEIALAEIEELHFYFSEAMDSIKTMTPRLLKQTFPISKVYDGEKFDCLDYFSTKKSLEEFEENKSLLSPSYKAEMTEEEYKAREKKVSLLIMDYQNKDIHKFNIAYVILTNKLNRMINGTDMMDKLFEEFPNLKEGSMQTYTDKNGKKYFIDSKGKIHRAKPIIPKTWKVITTKK